MKRALLLGLAVLLAATGYFAWRYVQRPKPLVLSGTIEALDADVGSLVGGRVAAVRVEEGSTVKKDQPLVEFESDFLDGQIRSQQGRLDAARADLEKALRGPRQEDIARAKADAQNTEAERRRQEALLKDGVVGQQSYDAAATAARIALETLEEKQRGSRPEDIASARAAVVREQGQLDYLERQRQDLVVRAPADGVIQTFDLRPGDLVAAGQPVTTILEPDQIWVRVYVPETRLGLVRLGQKAWIRVDTFPKREYPGKVVEIRSKGEYTPRNVQTLDQRMDQVFGVKVAIDPNPDLKPGMAATVRLE
ncbi:MAG TPA: HlyD family efflux transporter periplasmic adaptor subunit [Thermoanaerobaculia bacterium]|nr:HlyD family efflux transporter periplasmic adaptor subunit [Thermoanaerobaculia bacterium]